VKRVSLALYGMAAILTTGVTAAAHADEMATQLQNLVEKRAPSIVTVKVVLKSEFKAGGQGQDSESRMELQGVVVDRSGLVMVSSSAWSPNRFAEMMGGADNQEGFGVKVTPTEFKVIFERDEKEYSAFLAATDTKLDLGFLKIEDPLDRTVTAVDFGATATPTVGQQVVSVSRLPKGYDYAPYFESARISGVIAKPRKAWMLDGSISGFGLPVFSSSGEVLGVLTTVASGVKDASSRDSMGFSMFMRMMSGAGGGLFRAFLVPAPAVESVILQARQRAVEVAAQRAKNRANAKPVPEKKPAAPGKGK